MDSVLSQRDAPHRIPQEISSSNKIVLYIVCHMLRFLVTILILLSDLLQLLPIKFSFVSGQQNKNEVRVYYKKTKHI